jgi:hypothetical protein
VPICARQPREGGNGELVHIGVRSVCAGMAALAIGFAAESVGRRVVGVSSAGQRTESALVSVFETIARRVSMTVRRSCAFLRESSIGPRSPASSGDRMGQQSQPCL